MEGSADAADLTGTTSNTRTASGVVHSMTLLEVQSEQLAIKLQRELDGESPDAHHHSVLSDAATGVAPDRPDEHSAAAEEQQPVPASQTATNPAVHGVWSTSGPTAADLLRASNPDNSARRDANQSLLQAGGICTNESSSHLSVVPLSAGAVGVLVEMGVDEATAAAALRRCGGSDVARALDFCFSHDMEPLLEEDARLAAASPQDADSDLAFAMALEEEERRAFEARRRAAAAGKVAEGCTFGSKIQIGSAPTPVHAQAESSSNSTTGGGSGRKWGAADAENAEDGIFEDGEGDDPASTTSVNAGTAFGEGVAGAGAGGELEKGFITIPGGGRRKGKMPLFRNAEGEIVSKHDAVICGRMNARDASKLDGVGDLTAAGVRLSNRSYNSLKRDIRKKKEKGMTGGVRVEVATRSTQEGVMDEHTRLLVFKMVNAGTLAEVHGMVKTGKEAHVYHAAAPVDPDQPSGEIRGVAIKIFKTTLNEFGNRAAYVDGDPRYPNVKFNKQSRRKMFSVWAKKEHRNLIRMHRVGLPCPEPILQREHVLVMSFVGTDHWPAPQLRELDLSRANWRRCYTQVVELIRVMYQQCRLVHADLSEYNVLYHQKVCHMIDVGQAVDIGHSKAREYLSRDISVVTEFFRRQGVDHCLDTALAEEFIVDYCGPFKPENICTMEDDSRYGGGGRGGGDGGPSSLDDNEPPTGLRVLSELMAATVKEDAGSLLRSFCDAAAALSTGGYEEEENNDDEEEENYEHDHNDDDDEQEEATQTQPHGQHSEVNMPDAMAPMAIPSDGSIAVSASASASASGEIALAVSEISAQREGRSSRAAEELKTEEGGTDYGWEIVSEESLLEDESKRAKGGGDGKTVRPNTSAKGKVELGERERARTSDAKERLKAGIFSYDS